MTRILLAECKQEVSSFNPVPSRYADFRIVTGPDLLRHHRGVREELGGAISVFDAAGGIELVPTLGASANTSGGVLGQADFDRLAGELLEQVDRAGPVDGACISLHGAMQAAGESDPEGYLLTEIRRRLGPGVPLVVSLDLHGILTDQMLRASDAVVAYHTYPHVDFYETGARAARLLLRILRDGARPVTARVKIPALVRGDELITETGAIGECIVRAREIEAAPGGLSAAVMWGNPFTDVPELGTSSLVVLDGNTPQAGARAKELAKELAQRFWAHHERMQVPLTGLADSVRIAAAEPTGTVVLMDAADAPSSGASGDGNSILAEMVRQRFSRTALIPLVDPPAVAAAFAAGIGAELTIPLGGHCDRRRFEPVTLTCRVKLLSDGAFRSESFGWPWNSGPTAVLQSGHFTLVVGTRPVSLFDRSWFWAHGQDPRRFGAVVVKSPHCEPHMFADWAARLLVVDAPGSTSANVRALGHVQCPRPMFPLDDVRDWQPQVQLFNAETA
ncbi:MAG: M81 family metallopeptidase [Planctomycetaceae bacterium]